MKAKGLMVSSALVLGLAFGAAAARGSVAVRISPTQPTATDSITVTVLGGFPSMCWPDVGPATAAGLRPDTLSVEVRVNYCGGEPGCMCAQFPVGYVRTCKFPPLAVGVYVVRLVELHVNPADPLPTATAFASFIVSAPTPTSPRSWGSLKTHHR